MKLIRRQPPALLRLTMWIIVLYISGTFVFRGFHELQNKTALRFNKFEESTFEDFEQNTKTMDQQALNNDDDENINKTGKNQTRPQTLVRGVNQTETAEMRENKVEKKHSHLTNIYNNLHELLTNRTKPLPVKSILDLINENINVEDKENLASIGIYLSPNKNASSQLLNSWDKKSKDFIYNNYKFYCRYERKNARTENVCPCARKEHSNFGEFTVFSIF